MNKEQFDSLYFGKVVHCDTKEKAKEFLALADSVGYKWFSGSSLIGRSSWETHEKETYYRITNHGLVFGNTNDIKQKGCRIIEYQPPKFKVGDKVRVKIYPLNSIDGKIGVVEKVEDPTYKGVVSIETIKAIFKKELGVNLYFDDVDLYFSKNLNYSVMSPKSYNSEKWYVGLRKETKSGVDLELVNHAVKTEKDLLDLIKKFKKVRKMI